MLSLRLKAIASFLNPTDKVADIGADHGYLGIYVTQNKLVDSIILTDIKETALQSARKNVAKAKLNIPLIVTDGLKELDTENLNTLVISGMGTSTILHILSNQEKIKPIKKLILQSNNDLEILRRRVTSLGYNLIDEKTVFDKGFWYIVCLFVKNSDNILDEEKIKYGILKKDKIPYYEYLLKKNKTILNNIQKENPNLYHLSNFEYQIDSDYEKLKRELGYPTDSFIDFFKRLNFLDKVIYATTFLFSIVGIYAFTNCVLLFLKNDIANAISALSVSFILFIGAYLTSYPGRH